MLSSKHRSAMSISKSVAAYTLLPDFWSRLVGFMPRFGLIAYLMAVVFESVKLLRPGHPFSRGKDMNTYRIRDVLAYAANNLHGGFKNSDQYIVFGIFVLGVVLLGLQFVFLFAMLATNTANAAIPFVGLFVTVNPQTDLAHMMMDKVFGIPGFFNSCFDPGMAGDPACVNFTASASFPSPFQTGMQALFRFYSFGILTVAAFVVFYFIIAMILETTNTGVPFGNRFQSIFTPIRLVIAILLLLPLAYGYNTGQYIVLWAAKYGSALATNAWLLFNSNAGPNPLGLETKQLVGKPKIGEISSVVNFMYLVKTCEASYLFGVKDTHSPSAGNTVTGVPIKAYLVRQGDAITASTSQELATGTTFTDALTFYGQGDVTITFGQKSDGFANYPGNVKPYCGMITMPALSKNVTGITDLYNVYFKNVRDMWFSENMTNYGAHMACVLKYSSQSACSPMPATTVAWDAADDNVAGPQFYINNLQTIQSTFNSQMDAQITTVRTTTNPAIDMDAKTLLFGWGGAGLWFNKIMSFNGAMVDVLHSLPTPTKYPLIMEHVAKKNREFSPNVQQRELFSMSMPTGAKATSMDRQMSDSELGESQSQNIEIAKLLNETYVQIQDTQATSRIKITNTDTPIKNFITLLFGSTGIFDFRGNSEVFPLAKLAMLGREIIDKTITILAVRTIMTGVGSVVGAELGPMGDVLRNLGPGIGTFAIIGTSLGIMLYYVLPLMPFVYFFFGLGRWVKSIFEAMVAVPLWAMAHLRLGGEGIPGPAAGQGYFLILEIFLRPILTLFGLMAAVATFTAMSYALDSVFNLAVFNVGGYDMTTLSSGGADTFAKSARDGLDALFYTVIYAMFIYMIATSSFKLIDLIPNAVMRWGGTNTASFNDQTDAVGQVQYNLGTRADQMVRSVDADLRNAHDSANMADLEAKRKQLTPG